MKSSYLLIFGYLQTKKADSCCDSSVQPLNPVNVKEEACKSLISLSDGEGENRHPGD